MDKQTRERFLKHLRDALNHLHDPNRLRHNPLADQFGVANQFDTPSLLRDMVISAIESLEPNANEPSHSRAWRIYDTLFYRYVQQFNQQEVADQLGISTRQLRREQNAAIETLAGKLWKQHKEEMEQQAGEATQATPTQDTGEISPTINDELAWLKDGLPGKPTDLVTELRAVQELAHPHADHHGVDIRLMPIGELPNAAIHPVALHQILLSLLGLAMHHAPGKEVRISARKLAWEVEITIQGEKSADGASIEVEKDEARLDMARQMVELCKCDLAISSNNAFNATLTIPALEQLPVLAIDDNADTLHMLKRYTSGTHYHLEGTQDPEQAITMVEKMAPRIIVLDVMMPQVDGWRVLGRLRQHPLTSDTPILVCTILDQQELALSLGATGFLRKPVTQQEFLAALDLQAAALEPTHH